MYIYTGMQRSNSFIMSRGILSKSSAACVTSSPCTPVRSQSIIISDITALPAVKALRVPITAGAINLMHNLGVMYAQ